MKANHQEDLEPMPGHMLSERTATETVSVLQHRSFHFATSGGTKACAGFIHTFQRKDKVQKEGSSFITNDPKYNLLSKQEAPKLTSTRSDMFCPKTNFAPESALFVAFFELREKTEQNKTLDLNV